MSFTHSLKWSFLSEIATKLIQPIVFIILARLLTPEDFGIMTAALMVIAFSQVFWEAGMGKALIQRQTDIEEAANVVFWVNLGLSILIVSLLFIAAKPIAKLFFQDQQVTTVIQVMTFQVFLGAISSVHTALLQKEMGFKKLFWVRFITISLPGIASIPLAWNGMGYWALVVGTLVGQTAQVMMLWRMSAWRPKYKFHTQVAKEMGYFGAWVGMSGLLAWFYMWADSLILGMYLGNHELGLYRTGNQFSSMIFILLFSAVTPVLYSYLSKNKAEIHSVAHLVIKVIAVVAIPIAVIIFSVADSLANALFDEKWVGISIVIGIMALMHGYSWIIGMNGEFYRAAGKPHYETIITAGALVFYLGGYLLSIQYGFESFIWTRLALAIGALFLHLVLFKYLFNIALAPILFFIFFLSIISFITTLTINHIISHNISGNWLVFISSSLLSLLLIYTFLYFKEKNKLVKDIKFLTKRKFS